MKKAVIFAAVVLPLALSGCIDDTALTGHRAGLYARVAGTTCGVGTALFGGGSGVARAARGILGGGVCAAIGHEIGRELDERDRQRMELARAQVLRQRLPAQYYRPGYQAPGSYQTASGYGGASPSGGFVGRSRTTPANPPAADAPPPSPSASSGRFAGLAPVQGAQWVSDHSGATGSVTVVSAEKPKDGHGECRNLVQTVRQSGEAPVSEAATYCESRPGADDWAKL